MTLIELIKTRDFIIWLCYSPVVVVANITDAVIVNRRVTGTEKCVTKTKTEKMRT